MLPELERGVADDAGVARLRIALNPGPWCWPSEDMIAANQLASAATGLSGPPGPQIGVIPGVTVEDSCALVWLIDAGEEPTAGDADLGDTCRQSWHDAALALPRAVPLLWTSVTAAHANAPRLRLIGSHVTGRGIAPTCRLVRGPSFGLAFLLILASKVFRVPLPGDLVASAAITEDGRIQPVHGLQLKIEAVVARMPGVRRLVVAAEQEDDARASAAGRLLVVGVASASQALDVVFGNALADLLIKEGGDPTRREELAGWFFRFCLQGRGELVDWSPIAAAAKHALETWPELTGDQRFQLAFARGIAERHEWNGGTLPVPSAEWLLSRPATLRAHLAAHLVQQVADAGQPTWEETEPLVRSVRQPALNEAHAMQLRVEGALARLWSITGRPRDALQRQEELARTYFDSLLYGEVSFPLAEWYRLSGVCTDQAAFERADQMSAAVKIVGGLGLAGSAYVELARCKALALLDSDADGLIEALSHLARSKRGPAHLRLAAARYLLRQPRESVSSELYESVDGDLREAANSPMRGVRRAAAVNSTLVNLDAALLVDNNTGAEEALGTLAQLEPAIVAHLKSAAPMHSDIPRYVARHYPY